MRTARTARIAAAALLAGSAAVLTAPAALADPVPPAAVDAASTPVTPVTPVTSFGFEVSPSAVAAGGTVTLSVTDCDRRATASSGVFDEVTLQGHDGGKSATATVDSDAKPGAEYDVTFTCGSESATAPLTISAPATASTAPTPAGAVRTGLGGAVSGPDTAEVAAGAALAGLAGLAGAFALRRARSPRH